MKHKRHTIDDVARQAGVSKATVSAVLNCTGSVKDSTRDRVVSIIELLNYHPTQLGRRNGLRKEKCIALLIKEYDNPYYAEIIAGARGPAQKSGYTLLVVSSEGKYEAERRAVELLRAKDVDGLIITPVLHEHADLSHLFDLKRRNFPFVLLEEVRGVPASVVDVDNVEASRRAVEYLIQQGHTRIAHFAGPGYSPHTRERVDGVRKACSASRLIFTDADIVPAGAHLADGYRAGMGFFRQHRANRRPTAVTCYNDLVALGLCCALRELDLRVPDEVSVVGFDDIPLLEYLALPLTTVRIPKLQMGRVASQMIIRHIESRAVLPPQKVYLDSELVARQSTRALTEDSASHAGVDPTPTHRRTLRTAARDDRRDEVAPPRSRSRRARATRSLG
jgi:DNA-binding LacI/PurR family transcriptional regulator